MPMSDLLGGEVAGDSLVHVAPSHVHVSFMMVVAVPPPKRTITCRAASQTNPMFARALGAEGVAIFSHVRPFQVQVSFRYLPPPNPPKMTTLCLAASYAIPSPDRGVGERAGNCSLQLVPFHAQVSFMMAPRNSPPNKKVRFFLSS